MVEALDVGAYRVIDYLAANAPTVGRAFEAVAEYFPWVDSGTQIAIRPQGELMVFAPEVGGGDASLPAMEYMLAACYLQVRRATGIPFAPERVAFTHATPEHRAEVERVFGCAPRYDAGISALLFSAETWQLPVAHSDLALLAILEEHARSLRQAVPPASELLAGMARILADDLRSEHAVADVAKALGMSSRTLQRRLRDEGTSFSAVVDGVRRDAALRLLRDPSLSIAELTYLLGFAEASSLIRATKRWTGKTPTELRKTSEVRKP